MHWKVRNFTSFSIPKTGKCFHCELLMKLHLLSLGWWNWWAQVRTQFYHTTKHIIFRCMEWNKFSIDRFFFLNNSIYRCLDFGSVDRRYKTVTLTKHLNQDKLTVTLIIELNSGWPVAWIHGNIKLFLWKTDAPKQITGFMHKNRSQDCKIKSLVLVMKNDLPKRLGV